MTAGKPKIFNINLNFYLFIYLLIAVLGIELGALCVLGKCPIIILKRAGDVVQW